MSVIAELKRRNVFRVAALYLVAAWVLLQVGELLFGLLGLPACRPGATSFFSPGSCWFRARAHFLLGVRADTGKA